MQHSSDETGKKWYSKVWDKRNKTSDSNPKEIVTNIPNPHENDLKRLGLDYRVERSDELGWDNFNIKLIKSLETSPQQSSYTLTKK